MLSEDLENLAATLRERANASKGKLLLTDRQTDMLLSNLQLLATDIGSYERTNGPIATGTPNLAAIKRGLASGQVVSLADRRMSRNFTPDDGGSAA
ncbi:hypothetical protein [Thalassospira sp. MCCC 1A01428]|uniref:hypothetical protein n=1 Tax=Thalassospira sp. MCCC 1A01428 TaxID=1470575 RepID=UPI000A1F84D3|nr:hypothetical protein [Thalassospira sp. MCCC 1A01428]OSQ41651.1 hypothetical protein THS27_18195 [Thalassospira sp. MCCC 1A01428]